MDGSGLGTDAEVCVGNGVGATDDFDEELPLEVREELLPVSIDELPADICDELLTELRDVLVLESDRDELNTAVFSNESPSTSLPDEELPP